MLFPCSLLSLTLSCSGFSSSLSFRRSLSAVFSSWLICSVAWVRESSSCFSFSSFSFCSFSFMRSSSSSRNSLRRPNSAVTSSSRSPARSWNAPKAQAPKTRTRTWPPLYVIRCFHVGIHAEIRNKSTNLDCICWICPCII